MCGIGGQELEAERAQPAPTGHLDGLKLRTRDPKRRVRFLHGFGQHVAHRHLVPLGVQLDALVLEHGNDAADRVFPDLPLGLHVAVEAAEFGYRRGFAGAHLDAAVGDEIEAGDTFGDALRRVGGELDDAVAEPDVLGALAGRAEEYLRRRRMRVLFEEVVLDLPSVIVAEPVCQFHLGERILVELAFIVDAPRARQLQFIKNAKLHGCAPVLLASSAPDTGQGVKAAPQVLPHRRSAKYAVSSARGRQFGLLGQSLVRPEKSLP